MSCGSCGKTFKRLGYLRRHRACCELLHESKHVVACEEEEQNDLPSRGEIWLICQALAVKNAELEAKIGEMRGWVKRQKKKLSVIDWLNDNCKLTVDYIGWKRALTISDSDLELIFKHGFITGMTYILQRNLSLGNEHSLPIRAFEQKLNVLFVYENECWRMITIDEFRQLISAIHLKIHIQFKVWRDANQKMINDVNNNEEWHRNTSKVMGGKDSYDVAIRKISVRLYNYLKFNLRNIVQYEFTF